jgi:predicted lipoprotein
MNKKSLVALMIVFALLLAFVVALSGCKSKKPSGDTPVTTTQNGAMEDNEINIEDIFPVKTTYVTVTDEKGAPVTTYVNVTDDKGTPVTTYIKVTDKENKPATTAVNVTTAVVVTSVQYEFDTDITGDKQSVATTTTTTTSVAGVKPTTKKPTTTANIGLDDNEGWTPIKPIG